jgi:putative membrane protein
MTEKEVKGMWHEMDGMGWWMIWGAFMMVVFWGGLIVLGVWLAQSLTGRSPGGGTHSALDIAADRYARGEISAEQFQQIKSDLQSTRLGAGGGKA